MHRSLAASLAIVLSVAGGTGARAQTFPPVWQLWLNSLTSQGYTVTGPGSAVEFSNAYCEAEVLPYFGNCFASDPDDPYLQPVVPVGLGYTDPYYGPTSAEQLPNGIVASNAYRLADTEALLVIMNLPPQAAYLSYETFDFSRLKADYQGSTSISPDPARASLFASFGNSVNNANIAAQYGTAWGGGTIAFITTSNSALATGMVNDFAPVGGNPAQLFVEPIGTNVITGLTASADDLNTVIRYSVPADTNSGNAWRQNIAGETLVYRIDQPATMATTRYATPSLRTKAYNTSELDHKTTLLELTGLLKTWLAAEENDSAVASHALHASEKVNASGQPISGFVGPICIAGGADCTSDEQDALYHGLTVGRLRAGRMIIDVGVNHAVLNNNAFTSVSASDATVGMGLANSETADTQAVGFASGNLGGSAAAALQALGLIGDAPPGLIADLPNLYVQIYTRPCTSGSYCGQSFTTVLTPSALPYHDSLSTTERAYLLPGTAAGPNANYVLGGYAIY